MPKNIRPVMGTHIEDTLRKFAPGLPLDLFNVDGCCKASQTGTIRIKLHYLLELARNTDPKDMDEGARGKHEHAIESFATLTNSFRLDCHDCLNADCQSRDPNCPVAEVQKRAKHFEKKTE